jgi:mono/diheme cytochrome c family protein
MNWTPWLAFAAVLSFVARAPAAETAGGDSGLTYEQHVRPILKAYCFDCHGEGEKLRGGLDLRLRRLIVQGGDSGPGLVPGRRDDSLLFEHIHQGEMPPGKKKLSNDQVELIGRWIAAGARTVGTEPQAIGRGLQITAEERAFWSFQPVRRPAAPDVQPADRVRTPVDAWLLARLREKNLSFAPDAEKPTLVRRAFFDLLGLPPTPKDVAAFLADDAPDAYDRLLDRLLASPRYGERWGRHWLDVAGYADSEGYSNEDTVRPHAYKYRDYVIRSFTADKPFDQFIREQLAGDEMVRYAADSQVSLATLGPDAVEKLVATGFLRTAPDGTGSAGVDQDLARNQVIADTLKIVSTSLLGLSVGCAQCHNHRHDPIPQTDYYRLRAVFEPAYDWKNWRTPPARRVSLSTDADRARAKEIEAEAAKIDQERLKKQQEYIDRTLEAELQKLPEDLREPVRAARTTPPAKQTPEQKKLLKEHPSVNVTAGSLYLYDSKAAADLKQYVAKAAAVRAAKPVEDFVRALTEAPGQVPATHLFHRGDHTQPKQAVAPGGLTILDEWDPLPLPAADPPLPTTGRRSAFAQWLTDGKHPLTARVLVNRVWMHHFGRGIVGTPADFGTLGERPTHPELLDWLASEFVEGGWRLKRLHKLIMTSTAYRQSARRDPDREKLDPDNRWLGRTSVRRLEAEVIRDAMLAVSGKLHDKPFGPPVPVKENEVGQFVLGIDNKDTAGRFTAEVPLPPGEEFRRSVYAQVRRSRPLGVLDTFDAPAMEPNCEARTASTVTPQSLMLMNSAFIVAQAGHFADRVRREAGEDPRARVVRAWRLAFGDEPADLEVQEALAFVAEQTELFREGPPAETKPAPGKKPAEKPDPERQALASFCQALLSANQFLYVD